MALENLKQNLKMEKEILKELLIVNSQLQNIYNLYPYEKRESERKLLIKTINSLNEQMKIINNSIPEIVNAISPYKGLEGKPEIAEKLVKINYIPSTSEKIAVTIEAKNKERFLSELNLSRQTIQRIKHERSKGRMQEEIIEFKQAGFYARLANKLFQNFSNKLIDRDKFKILDLNLRKANLAFLLVTYLSVTFLSTFLALISGIIIFLIIAVIYPESILKILSIIPALPLITFLAFYFYPYAEKKSIAGKINQEIPFVTIHMSAIAGSGIEPSQIFKIIAIGEEYPHTKRELKKIINQINVYGFDLVTSLKNTARETSSKKLSELLNGMASAISGGSELSVFLDKRSETLLFEYKLEREKYTKSAETLMDIYISLMIAAPMIMTLLLVLISVSTIDIGLSLKTLTILILSIVALINFVFLVFLHLSGQEE